MRLPNPVRRALRRLATWIVKQGLAEAEKELERQRAAGSGAAGDAHSTPTQRT